MKVLIIKTDNTVKAVQVFAQWNNEISFADIRKLVSSRANMIYVSKISRLAYLYVLYVEKDTKDHPINIVATLLASTTEHPIKGDVVLVRTEHLGSGAKIFALEDEEITKIADRISKIIGKKVELTH